MTDIDKLKPQYEASPIKQNPFTTQIGGDYYKDITYKNQPFDFYAFFEENSVVHSKAAIIRRIWRYNKPNGGGSKDLQKIIHECQLLLAIHYDETKGQKNSWPK